MNSFGSLSHFGSLADFGESALIAALIITLCCFVLEPVLRLLLKRKLTVDKLQQLGVRFQINLVWMSTLLIAVSFGLLMYAFYASDFSLATVFENSQRTDPLIYKIAALWSHHEGSFLLWVLVAGLLMTTALLMAVKKISTAQLRIAIYIFAIIQASFLIFLLFQSNPFARMGVKVHQGLGMNPLLQDPSMTFHPPMLYLGFVGYVVLFAQTAAIAWRSSDVTKQSIRWVRNWSAIAWIFLTLGITTGSIWAYYELGWGGWWAWDPVENASLLPWLLGTAHLHQLTRLRGVKLNSSQTSFSKLIGLGFAAFLLSLLGTYITRSGAIASIHGFARDDTRGLFLLGIMGGLILLSAVFISKFILDTRDTKIHQKAVQSAQKAFWIRFQYYGILLVTLIVLLATLFPLYAPHIGIKGNVIAPDFYNAVLAPITAVLLVAMSYSLMKPPEGIKRDLIWQTVRANLGKINSALLIFVALIYLEGLNSIHSIFIIPSALLLVITLLDRLFRDFRYGEKSNSMAMYISHFGFAVMLLGMAVDAGFGIEKTLVVKAGARFDFATYNLNFAGVKQFSETTYKREVAIIQVLDPSQEKQWILNPERRLYLTQNVLTTKSAILTDFLSQLYVVLGAAAHTGERLIMVAYHPLVLLIWIGGVLIAFGGVLILLRGVDFLGRKKQNNNEI